jgi:transposase
MLVVETIGKIRRDHFVHGRSIKTIARERGLARNTVRKVLRSNETALGYARTRQPRPKLGEHVATLEAMLEENSKASRRDRLTLMRIFELLQAEGYSGSYDAVRRHAQRWRREHSTTVDAYVPLSFEPGEAYQFDWSHEVVVLNRVTTTVKAAHMRLCHSRMPVVQAYPRESQEMVFDAHDRAFAFYGGACTRGIYDNMKTAVDAVFVGKERQFNRRFAQLCSHYLVEPVACTPGAGWEKGQVESQVGKTRQRLFTPRLRFDGYRDLNDYLLEQSVAEAKQRRHPEYADRTVFEMFEAEREALIPYAGPFDGYRTQLATVSKTCLVRFDHNHYSVMANAVGRPVEIQAYADRVVIRQDGHLVGDHARHFGRGQSVYDPWHYLPVLAKKPGALRNGAPFKDWVLPKAIALMAKKLTKVNGGDRHMVDILSAVTSDGLEAVEAACAEALAAGIASRDVVLNALARRQQPQPPNNIVTSDTPTLSNAPIADCSRYDRLRVTQ